MGKHNFGYFVHEGLSNMFSHGFMSFAAIGITVACLLIMGTFSLVAVNANALLAVLAGADSGISSVEDLNQAGKVLAVKSGSTGHMYAEKNLPEAELLVLPDESACVTEVAQGRADGFIYDQLTIYRNWQNNLDTTTAIFIPFQDVEKWGIAVQKGNQKLLDDLNAFLADFQANGGYEELTEKYLAEEKKAFDELGFQWFFDMKK